MRNVACSNGVNPKEVNLELNIINPESKTPRYELVFYENGREIARRVFESGKTISSEGEIPDGTILEYYESGRLKNIFNYTNGKRNGKALSFYESGRLRATAFYHNDNPIGITKRYYENGNLMVESKIENGKQVYYKDYYENGQLKQEIYYKGDNIIRREYDVHGRIVENQ